MTTKCGNANPCHSFTLSHLTTFSVRMSHPLRSFHRTCVFSVRPSPEVESGLHPEGLLALVVERLSRERQRGITLKEEPWRPFVNKKQLSASVAGDVSLGGEISAHGFGFGAMRLTGEGIWGPPKDRKGALAVLRRAVELDINFIDTPDSYGPHVNEELIAEALFPYPAGLVIATKGGWNRPGPNQWTHDAAPAHLRKAIEGSLKRLRLDRIDLYQLHVPDPVASFEASMDTLAQLRMAGKIRLIGLSNVPLEHNWRAGRTTPPVSA